MNRQQLTVTGLAVILAASVLFMANAQTDQQRTPIKEAQRGSLSASSSKVGDVRFSLLAPKIFEKQNPGWVLMDGRKVSESSGYHKQVGTTLPDARNQFIRAMGGMFDAADGNLAKKSRTPGSIQGQSTAGPKSPFIGKTNSGGQHSHRYQVGNAVQGHKFNVQGGEFSGRYEKRFRETEGDKMSKHSHAFVVSGGGDAETRPTNLAMYVYVRID